MNPNLLSRVFFIGYDFFVFLCAKKTMSKKNINKPILLNLLKIIVRRYQDIEYGKTNIPGLTSIALSDYFYVSLDYLVGRSDIKERRRAN